LAADRVVGAPTVGPVGCTRCTSRPRSVFPGLLPSGSLSLWRWAAMSGAPGSRPRGTSCRWGSPTGDGGGRDCWDIPAPPLGGWHDVRATSEVNGTILREAPPIGAQGAQRGPAGVLGAWPLRGNDQHVASLPGRLCHHLLYAAEGFVCHQGPGLGVVPGLGEHVILLFPVRREAVVG